MFTQFEANPADHQAVISKKTTFWPTRLRERGTQFAPHLSLLPSRPITAFLPPQCAVKTVADLESSESFLRKMRLFPAEAASKNFKKRLSE